VSKRSYDQFCGLARALDLVGERWTLLLVRDLALGPQRYSDLLAGLPGIGTGLLAERLKQLEAEGLVQKSQLPPPAQAVTVYELTDDGRDLSHAMLPLAFWGARRLGSRDPGLTYRTDWLLHSLWATFKPAAAAGVHDVYELHLDGDVVHITVDDGDMEVRRGPAPGRPDLRVTTDPETLFAIGLGRITPQDAAAAGKVDTDGDPDALARMVAILGPAPSPAT
jgi:DNA-binding HxlR family transcriptional regulator